MRVVNAEIVPLSAPYFDPDLPADDPTNGALRNCVWVRLDPDEGIGGWGEAYCGVYATEVTIAALRRLLRASSAGTPATPVR